MSNARYTKADYVEAILVGILVTVLITSLQFLLLNTIPSDLTIFGSFFAGVLAGGVLVRLRKKRPPEKPPEDWMPKRRNAQLVAFGVVIGILAILITLFQVAFSLTLLALAVFAGLNLGVFVLVLRPPGYSETIVRGARQALYVILFGSEAFLSVAVLLQELPYVLPTTGLTAIVMIVTVAAITYYMGRLTMT